MKPTSSRSGAPRPIARGFAAICCVTLLIPGEGLVMAQGTAPPPAAQQPARTSAQQPAPPAPATPAGSAAPEATKLPPEQLDSLVAPIALFPDPLLAQTLVASTYPLEIVQLQQWLSKHKDLKDKALADAVAKEPWDPSIQSMAATPEVVKRLADDIQWTTDLGNAFLAQQSDVMDAVQRMRKKAKDNGALESNDKQKVETQVVEQKTVIVVEPASPEVIYVPSYSPTVVYGPPVYPYPPIYYPPYPPGAAFVSFSFGVMMGAAFWGGSCCGCGWHGGDVNINVNNNFNKVSHYDGNRGGGNWQHNPQHRGAAPYGDKGTANKYGGSARGQPRASQQPSASQRGGAGARGGSPGVSDRSAGGGANRGGGPSAGDRAAGGAGGRGGSPSVGDRSAGGTGAGARGGAGGGGDRIGSRDIPQSSASRGGGGFGGGSGGWSGSSARSSASRGASSMGGRGGGGRGGGGGRRR